MRVLHLYISIVSISNQWGDHIAGAHQLLFKATRSTALIKMNYYYIRFRGYTKLSSNILSTGLILEWRIFLRVAAIRWYPKCHDSNKTHTWSYLATSARLCGRAYAPRRKVATIKVREWWWPSVFITKYRFYNSILQKEKRSPIRFLFCFRLVVRLSMRLSILFKFTNPYRAIRKSILCFKAIKYSTTYVLYVVRFPKLGTDNNNYSQRRSAICAEHI